MYLYLFGAKNATMIYFIYSFLLQEFRANVDQALAMDDQFKNKVKSKPLSAEEESMFNEWDFVKPQYHLQSAEPRKKKKTRSVIVASSNSIRSSTGD
tara:strand:+ start:879 stop:1169 length:291 start_codon:yes stop_codon:yes gene_type:complete